MSSRVRALLYLSGLVLLAAVTSQMLRTPPSWVHGSPLVHEGVIVGRYLPTLDGEEGLRVGVWDAETFALKWSTGEVASRGARHVYVAVTSSHVLVRSIGRMLAAYDLETGEQVASHALPHGARALCPLEDDKVWVAHAQADELSGAVLSLADGTWEAASRPARCVGAVEQKTVSCGKQTMLGTGSDVTCAPISNGGPDEALELTLGAGRVLLELQLESGVVAPIALGQSAAGSPWRVSLLSDPTVGVGKLPLAVDLQEDDLYAVVPTQSGPLHVVRVDAAGQRVWETPAPGWPAAHHAKLLVADDRVYVAHALRVSVFDRATGAHLGDVGDTTWFYGTSCAGGSHGFVE